MKRVIVTFCFFLILSFVFCACSRDRDTDSNESEGIKNSDQISSDQNKSFDLQFYKQSASELREKIKANYVLIGNMATYEINAFKVLGRVDSSCADSAFEWLEKNSEHTKTEVIENNEIIRTRYANLIIQDIEGKEAGEIDSSIRTMYDAYSNLYNCVTAPSGTLNSFGSEIKDILSSFEKADDNMAMFLD